jgi:hypothetical protein
MKELTDLSKNELIALINQIVITQDEIELSKEGYKSHKEKIDYINNIGVKNWSEKMMKIKDQEYILPRLIRQFRLKDHEIEFMYHWIYLTCYEGVDVSYVRKCRDEFFIQQKKIEGQKFIYLKMSCNQRELESQFYNVLNSLIKKKVLSMEKVYPKNIITMNFDFLSNEFLTIEKDKKEDKEYLNILTNKIMDYCDIFMSVCSEFFGFPKLVKDPDYTSVYEKITGKTLPKASFIVV